MATYAEEQGMLEVHVADLGKGIREADMEKIFTLFGQVDDGDGYPEE